MDEEKRSNEIQSRRVMMEELTDAQRAAVTQLESFGWFLAFVRRPIFKPVVPILQDDDSGRYAILEADGSLNEDHDLDLRV